MTPPILSLHDVSTGYGGKQVLFGVSLDVYPGESVLLVGGNGSGKSTLLKAAFGLLPPWNTGAAVRYFPDPAGPPVPVDDPARNLSAGLAYVPQKGAVFDNLTLADHLKLSGLPLGRAVSAERRREVCDLLPDVRPLLGRKPEAMSGGERQLAALATACVRRPRVMLIDEPLAGLSAGKAGTVLAALAALRGRAGTTLVIVDHRVAELSSFADRVVAVSAGHVRTVGRKPPQWAARTVGRPARPRLSVAPAAPGDAEAIHHIAARNSIHELDSLAKGFLLFPFTAAEYRELIVAGHPVAAIRDETGRVVGFVCGVWVETALSFCASRPNTSTASLLRRIAALAAAREETHAAVVYQMALEPERRGQGAGVGLFRGYAEAFPVPCYGVVMTAPVASTRHAFWRLLGFREIDTINLEVRLTESVRRHPEFDAPNWSWVVMRRGETTAPRRAV